MNLVSGRRLSEITADYLVTSGFSKTDAYLGVSALRFLGLINSEGKTEEIIKKLLLQGDAHKAALAEIVQSAYSKIFNKITDLESATPEDLHNEFVHEYALSPRVARSAVPAFLWLCQSAGLKKEGASQPRPRSAPGTAKAKKGTVAATKSHEPKNGNLQGNNLIPLWFDGDITMTIPFGKKITEALGSGEYRDMLEAVNKFASLLAENEPKSTE